MLQTRATAPGKVILAGEHAAVYGHPALVAALGQRASATVTELARREDGAEATVEIELPELGVRQASSWRELSEQAAAAREHWRREIERPASFRPLHRDATALVRLALGEALAARPGVDRPAVRVVVGSEIPLGAGCGSSAAVASAVVGATLALLDRGRGRGASAPPSLDELEPIVLEVERRQHGAPSGVDAATVLRGGVLWCHRESGVLRAEPVRAETARGNGGSPLEGLGAFALLHTGTPRESTGEVVARVRARRDAEPARIGAALERIAGAAVGLRGAVEARIPDGVVAALRDCARGLEELGVVPAALGDLRGVVEAAGGAAKVSGAGTMTGEAAGVMLVYHPSLPALQDLRRTLRVGAARWLPELALGGPGIEVE